MLARILVRLAILPLLLVVACATGGSLTGREWMLASVDGFPTIPSGAATPTLTFGTDGRLTGNTGCNSASAAYTATGDQLSIDALITTRRACVDPAGNQLESAYVRAVEAARSYRIAGGELQLLDSGGAVVARFR